MNYDAHAIMRDVADKSLAGAASPQEEQSLREHLDGCDACRGYLNAGHRVVAGLGGFSFDVDAELEARVGWLLKLRAQQLKRAAPSGQRVLWGSAAALVLLVAGSLAAWQFGGLVAASLHMQLMSVQKTVLVLWVLPSLCFFLLFPALPLLSNREGRVL